MSLGQLSFLTSWSRSSSKLNLSSFRGTRRSLSYSIPTFVKDKGCGAYRRTVSTATNGKQRIALTLYRQLLRWCNGTEDEIPLSYYIPPIYMQPPQIDATILANLASDSKNDFEVQLMSMFPPSTIVDSHQLTVPIRNASDAKAFFRSIFRLNASNTTDPELQKQQITLAFEALKSLNELNEALQELRNNREHHQNRENIRYRVGQGRLCVYWYSISF